MSSSPPSPYPSWRRQMLVIWLSQCLSIMGFSFAFPFAPYFLQVDLGVTDTAALAMWVSLFSFSTAISMGIAAPFWGALADRFGRRVMLIRATFAGAVCMSLMGGVHSAGMLIFLRALQGGLTGTMTAAQAFLSGEVPPERRGLAVGGLSAAVFSGSMSGAFLGGWVADSLGYRAAFYASGLLLLLAGSVVVLFTRETAFVPSREGRNSLRPKLLRKPSAFAASGGAPLREGGCRREATGGSSRAASPTPRILLYVLALVALLSFIRQQDFPFLPLLVQDILGSLDRASLWTGWLNATGSVAGLLAGLLAGWLADHVPPFRVLVVGAALAAAFSASQALAHTFGTLFPVRFMTVFTAGLLEPTLTAIIARRAPADRQGRLFGWACTTRSFGWALGPLVAGFLAAQSLRFVFYAAGLAYLLFALASLLPLLFSSRSPRS